MRKRPIKAPIRRVDQMEYSPIDKGKTRTRNTINKTIKEDLDFNSLSIDMIYDKAQ